MVLFMGNYLQVTEDFLPIITRIKATTAPFGGPKGEILYAREHEAVWFKGKGLHHLYGLGLLGRNKLNNLNLLLIQEVERLERNGLPQ